MSDNHKKPLIIRPRVFIWYLFCFLNSSQSLGVPLRAFSHIFFAHLPRKRLRGFSAHVFPLWRFKQKMPDAFLGTLASHDKKTHFAPFQKDSFRSFLRFFFLMHYDGYNSKRRKKSNKPKSSWDMSTTISPVVISPVVGITETCIWKSACLRFFFFSIFDTDKMLWGAKRRIFMKNS